MDPESPKLFGATRPRDASRARIQGTRPGRVARRARRVQGTRPGHASGHASCTRRVGRRRVQDATRPQPDAFRVRVKGTRQGTTRRKAPRPRPNAFRARVQDATRLGCDAYRTRDASRAQRVQGRVQASVQAGWLARLSFLDHVTDNHVAWVGGSGHVARGAPGSPLATPRGSRPISAVFAPFGRTRPVLLSGHVPSDHVVLGRMATGPGCRFPNSPAVPAGSPA